ncbi:VPS10 domain-containing protein [Labilibacter marinus]|uniref:VPS10 domain-containing protein n=1 Tax=Labilibacter marinus TaxID=1477105 RepID=UPI00083087F3|nr:T9SS type A sorting domain-containing protein [Labilibacter marinus]
MKRAFLLTTLNLIVFCLWGNELIFESSFEQDLSVEWASTLSTGMPTFEIKTEAKHTGNNGLHFVFSEASQKGNLTTPKIINWEEGVSYEISFWYKAIIPTDNSASNIKLFDNIGTKIGHINISPMADTEWTQYKTTFTSNGNFNEGYALFSFRPNDTNNSNYYLDDFKIEKVVVEPSFSNDLKTKKVESDPNIVWKQFGPGMSGNCKSAFWHPTDPNVLFVGPNMGNSYGTWDKGETYESILNEDESDFKRGYRGPIELTSLDFSRLDADFGMCTDERNQGIFYTEDRGHKWTRLPVTTFDGIYVDAVAVDPKDDDIWYAGGGRLRNLGSNLYPHSQPKGTLAHAGSLNKIWKSTDKGQTWILKNNGLEPETGIETLLVDPKNSNIVYASTSTGFYKSTNGGDLWVKKISGIDYDMLRAMDYHYNEADDILTMIVISNPMWKADGNTITDDKGGLFKSVDRGESWQKISGNIALDMRQFQNNSDVKKSYMHCAAYVFDMTDEDFEAAYPTLPSKITIRFNTVEIDPNDVNNIYLNNEYSNASRNNFKPGQVWRSSDGGVNWHICHRNGKAWKVGSSDYNYWVQRGNPMGNNLSLKYKKEWIERDFYERKGCNFVKFNADGSVLHTQLAKISLMSYDKGETWLDIDDEYTTDGEESYVGAGNSNVPGHGFSQHPLMPNKVFCFAGENSLWVTNDDGEKVRPGAQAATFKKILEDENSLSWYAVHPYDTTKHYALFFRQAKKGKLMRSTDAGETWAEHGEAVPYWDITGHSGDQSVHQIHLTFDMVNPDNMYFVVPKKAKSLEFVGDSEIHWGVHKSSDGGANWKDSNIGLPESLDATAIAIDPENNKVIYVAIQNADGGLFKSTDFGENWNEVESTQSISKSQGINDIHFSADNKVYITAGSKNGGIDDGGAWVSEDNMQTWTKVFDYPWTNRIETALYDPNTILISTLANTSINGKNAGTYLSKDAGENWIKINTGNGQSDRINDIAIDNYVPGKFYASTYGSGWYTSTDPNPNMPVKPTSIETDNAVTVLESETHNLNYTILPAETYMNNIIWKSDDKAIATVNEKGVVKGIAQGMVTITGTIVNTNISSSIQVTVEPKDVSVGKVSYKELRVYPNPCDHHINIVSEIHDLSAAKVEIISLSGKKILSQSFTRMEGNNQGQISVSQLAKGYYLLSVTTTNKTMLTSFIKL